MRRFGDPIDPARSYRTRPGAYGIIRDGDDILVTEQVAPLLEFQLPGGGIDPGEGPLQALHRECREETGWGIQPLRRLGAYQRYTYMPDYDIWARKVCLIYLCRPTLRRGPPSEPGHSAIWMPIRSALELLSVDGDRHFVAELRR
ncbi:MAG: NUDIX hydrolase [Amaricoccus sp.]